MSPALVVAIVNSSPDTVDMLRVVFQNAGMVVVTTFTHAIRDGEVNFTHFMRQNKPDVVVYDIALPYEANWRLFQHLRDGSMRGTPIVLTTTNAKYVEALLAPGEQVHELVGKPYDLEALVNAVKASSQQ